MLFSVFLCVMTIFLWIHSSIHVKFRIAWSVSNHKDFKDLLVADFLYIGNAIWLAFYALLGICYPLCNHVFLNKISLAY